MTCTNPQKRQRMLSVTLGRKSSRYRTLATRHLHQFPHNTDQARIRPFREKRMRLTQPDVTLLVVSVHSDVALPNKKRNAHNRSAMVKYLLF
jgi:hypothetical protein